MFPHLILGSLITPTGDEQALPGSSAELVTVWLDPSSGTVGLIGEVDSSNSEKVGTALEALVGQSEDLVLDLADLDFMDCSGLRMLVSLASRVADTGGRLVVESPRRIVRRAMALTKIDEHPHMSIEESGAGLAGGFALRQGIVQLI
jgi:anti-anti-sigma factor